MYDLAKMREQLLAQQSGSKTNSNNNYSSNFFNFSKLKEGDTISIRFVGDGDGNNNFFWRKRAVRQLKFNGVLTNGQLSEGEVLVDVPAFNLKAGETDASLPEEYKFTSSEDVIQQLIKPLWNGTPEGEETYRKFARKESYLYQGFVRTEGYETKLYRFLFSRGVNDRVHTFMTDDEQFENFPVPPVDVEKGRDFKLRVKMANGRRDYNGSSWSLSTSPLTPAENKYLEENGAFSLKDYLPKKPSTEQLEMMAEMFDAVCNDKPFDFDKWGATFKPSNVYKDSEGQIKFRAGFNSVDTEVSTKAETVKTEIPATVSDAPTTVSTETVNKAISENTTTVSGDNVEDMVANLMAQFNQQ